MTSNDNKAKAISAELLELILRINWKKRGKQDETGRKRKTGRKKHRTGRNRKKQLETVRNSKKL